MAGNADYELMGCYAEPSGGRALQRLVSSDTLTAESCLGGVAAGANYIGLEYGRECWYDNTLSASAVAEANFSNCSMRCAGNSLEYCGSSGHLTLYRRRVFSAPQYVPSVGSYRLQGCYCEPTNGARALGTFWGDNGMTVEACVARAAGAKYAGVEYGRECWYGNTLDAGAVLESNNNNCSLLCPGSSLEYCGASTHLLIYKLVP